MRKAIEAQTFNILKQGKAVAKHDIKISIGVAFPVDSSDQIELGRNG